MLYIIFNYDTKRFMVTLFDCEDFNRHVAKQQFYGYTSLNKLLLYCLNYFRHNHIDYNKIEVFCCIHYSDSYYYSRLDTKIKFTGYGHNRMMSKQSYNFKESLLTQGAYLKSSIRKITKRIYPVF